MMAVVTTACLLCVFFGYLMGLSVSRPNPPKAKSDDVHHVIRPLAAEGGDAVPDLALLEENSVHAFLSIFAPSAPSDSSTAT